jgi:hypothetical protein
MQDGLGESILNPPGKPPRARHSRKQPEGHIPRPPNAFILFRSSFIRNQRVSPDVETNPNTLSKIIGLTWKNLPPDERRVWYAKARQAVEEHRRRFPEYAFHPLQRITHGAKDGKHGKGRRKVREHVVSNPERCAKIAELLGEGKQGRALDGAMQEFDRQRGPNIITQFEPPVTATDYRRASSAPAPDTEPPTTIVVRRRRSSSSGPSSRSKETDALADQPALLVSAIAPSPSVEVPPGSDSLGLNAFSFESTLAASSSASDFTCDPLWPCGTQDFPMGDHSSPFSNDDIFKFATHQEQEYAAGLDLSALVKEDYAPPPALFSPHVQTPMAGSSHGHDSYCTGSHRDMEPHVEPGLSQIESDFMKLMAQYSLEA